MKILSLLLLVSSFSLSGMYHYRRDLESVKLLEKLRTAYEYDLPLEPFQEKMHEIFKENINKNDGACAQQTVLSHALREKCSADFIEFLKEKGIIDPLSPEIAPRF